MKLPLFITLALATLPALALDAACEPFVKAAEKSAEQPARHNVTVVGEGLRNEAIIKDGQMYMQLDGRWRKGPSTFSASEKKINAEMRSGKIKLSNCQKLGSETVDGVATTVYRYDMQIPEMGSFGTKTGAKVYIGDDGLIHAQATDDTKVRIRYTGVSVPKIGP